MKSVREARVTLRNAAHPKTIVQRSGRRPGRKDSCLLSKDKESYANLKCSSIILTVVTFDRQEVSAKVIVKTEKAWTANTRTKYSDSRHTKKTKTMKSSLTQLTNGRNDRRKK